MLANEDVSDCVIMEMQEYFTYVYVDFHAKWVGINKYNIVNICINSYLFIKANECVSMNDPLP